jgi:hypothetical protein
MMTCHQPILIRNAVQLPMDETAQNFEASTDAIIMLIGIFGMPSPSLGRLHGR